MVADFFQDVIPTGGGSLCPYIDNKMFEFCAVHGRRYLRTTNPDSAVSRGALISVMKEDFFGWRLSRAYFGILVQDEDRSYIKWFVLRVSESLHCLTFADVSRVRGSTSRRVQPSPNVSASLCWIMKISTAFSMGRVGIDLISPYTPSMHISMTTKPSLINPEISVSSNNLDECFC